MAPNSVDLDESMFATSFSNGSVSADGLQYVASGDGISVHVTTFNCANSPHPRPPIALPILPPDLLVLGLQELAPSNIAFMNLPVIEDVYLKGLESVAHTAQKQYGIPFELVKLVRVGQTALVIWSSLGTRLKKVQTAWAGCGLLGLLSNKGAAAARITLISENGREREVTFVAAHLAAHEYHFYRRNADFQCLVQNLVFPDQTGIFKPNTPLFFLGDLNYRLSVLHPSRSGTKLSITPADDEPLDDLSLIEKLKEAILDFLETGRFHKLVPHDQLPLSPLALHFFEAPINFGPTYKYVSHDPPTYANNRTPSWTDRILYSPETIKTTDYKPTTSATFSDHQAVSLTASLQEEDFALEDGIMPWPINQNWRRRREFADKLAYVAGTMEIMGESKIGGSLFSVMVLGAVLYFYYYS